MKNSATTTSPSSIGDELRMQGGDIESVIVDVEPEVITKPEVTTKPEVVSKSDVEPAPTTSSSANDASDYYSDDDYSEIHDGEYADSWSYEVPRPWLTVEQAASMLGRSVRGVERSILGRWGNHLPEGWSARRVRIDGVAEWRIIPPPGFRIKHSRRETTRRETEGHIEDVVAAPIDGEHVDPSKKKVDEAKAKTMSSPTSSASSSASSGAAAASHKSAASADSSFSFEKFFHSAGKMAQKELASFGLSVRPTSERERQEIDADIEHATIVIDRSDEVEKLLRELANTQKELAEQRRMHLDDLRLMHEMQSSMLLLEVHAKETGELKQDLVAAQHALREHRGQYQAFLALPWYKRLFRKTP